MGVLRRQLPLPVSITPLWLPFWMLVLRSEETAGMFCRSKRVSLRSPKSILGTQRIALTQFRGNSWDMESEADSKDHLNIQPSPSPQ